MPLSLQARHPELTHNMGDHFNPSHISAAYKHTWVVHIPHQHPTAALCWYCNSHSCTLWTDYPWSLLSFRIDATHISAMLLCKSATQFNMLMACTRMMCYSQSGFGLDGNRGSLSSWRWWWRKCSFSKRGWNLLHTHCWLGTWGIAAGKSSVWLLLNIYGSLDTRPNV